MKISSFLGNIITCYVVLSVFSTSVIATAPGSDLVVSSTADGFALSVAGKSAPMFVSDKDYPGVMRAAKDLQSDIGKVTGAVPQLFTEKIPKSKQLVIVGTLGKSPVIDKLVREGLIQVDQIAGKWESYQIQVVRKPMPGVKEALVITGSDKRGTIYGLYEISSGIGVSPWYWWADVPVKHKKDLYVDPGKHVMGEPSVKYRGIFLNDEAPALTNWVAWKYGMAPQSVNPPVPKDVAAYNSEFYSKIFELILRLKGNYLWPAMWNNAFNEDDTANARLADEYGIVMGTSHQEPMLRAQKEWDRRYKQTLGSWNWTKHSDTLINFWREGIRRNRDFESIITMGLRGADDTEMGPGGPAANMAKLEKIVEVQRKLLAEEINPDVTQIPQMWCLYKEVQDYYNEGLRVPDDVTLLWAEDNWGNVRRLPTPEERIRSGGAGVYYHFDYHGGPRSYQWINTNPVSKIWDQMSLAKQYGADRIWIVNVGHLKGYELPLEFFMDLAWNTDAFSGTGIRKFLTEWASEQFGDLYATDIADILLEYTRYNGRRKPELLSPSTYSLVNYNEAETVVSDYKDIEVRAEEIYRKLPEKLHDAYYQLVLFPVKASSLVNELYYTAGRNALYARQGRASANTMAAQTQLLFEADTSLMGYYNRSFAGGKWNHFMDQAHLGYLNWADPPFNSLRAINLKQYEVPDTAIMGVTVEGSEKSWPASDEDAVMPEFDKFNRQTRYFEVFNKGKKPFSFNVRSSHPWILTGEKEGIVEGDRKIPVSIDWSAVPEGRSVGSISIEGAGETVTIGISAFNTASPLKDSFEGFIEADGYVSIEPEHYTGKTDFDHSAWKIIEGYGKTLSGMRATAETDAGPAIPGKNSPCLEYQMYLFSKGEIEATLSLSPTLNFTYGRDLRIAVSVDNDEPQTIIIVPGNYSAQNGNQDWERSVMNNARYVTTRLVIPGEGLHKLKIWMIDPGVVVEKIVVNTGGVRASYLGPPESYRFRLR